MKTIVYIDGQNFLYKAADVLIQAGKVAEKQDLHTFSFRILVEKLFPDDDLEIRFYGTKLKRFKKPEDVAEKSVRMIDSQRRLRNCLALQSIDFVESGKLKLRDSDVCRECGAKDQRFQEKGVDVKIAVDMMVDGHKPEQVKFVIVSSDTDLLPPIQHLRNIDKQVVYVGFSDKLTNALVVNASETQIIRDAEIITAFDDANPPKLSV